MNVKTLPQRIWELALGALAVAFVLNWAWALLEPLVPVITTVGSVLVLVSLVIGTVARRRRHW